MVHALLSQDERQREGFWEVVGHVVFPFDLSRTPPIGGGLLVPFPGPPVVKQLMQMVTTVPGQGGRFRSVCFPNKAMAPGPQSPWRVPVPTLTLDCTCCGFHSNYTGAVKTHII